MQRRVEDLNEIWPRVIVAIALIASIAVLLGFGKVSEAVAATAFGVVGGFFFGQYVPSPSKPPNGTTL